MSRVTVAANPHEPMRSMEAINPPPYPITPNGHARAEVCAPDVRWYARL